MGTLSDTQKLSIDTVSINQVSVKSQGIIIFEHLTWENHTGNTADKLFKQNSSKIGSIKRIILQLHYNFYATFKYNLIRTNAILSGVIAIICLDRLQNLTSEPCAGVLTSKS